MTTLEQKIDLILEYIVADDKNAKSQMKERIADVLRNDSAKETQSTSEAHILDDIIDDLLKDIGIPCSLVGYDQIVHAVKLIISDRVYLEQMTKMLYPTIAEHLGTTPSRVERGIRHCVEVMAERNDIDNLYHIFGNTISPIKGKPTNSEFLAAITKIVKYRMRDLK